MRPRTADRRRRPSCHTRSPVRYRCIHLYTAVHTVCTCESLTYRKMLMTLPLPISSRSFSQGPSCASDHPSPYKLPHMCHIRYSVQ